jgi:hypothetical protein
MKKSVQKIILGIILILVVFGLFYLGFNNKSKGEGEEIYEEDLFDDEGILIGGCGGVALEYQQECCDNWAIENNILKIMCVGEWSVLEGKCSWICK